MPAGTAPADGATGALEAALQARKLASQAGVPRALPATLSPHRHPPPWLTGAARSPCRTLAQTARRCPNAGARGGQNTSCRRRRSTPPPPPPLLLLRRRSSAGLQRRHPRRRPAGLCGVPLARRRARLLHRRLAQGAARPAPRSARSLPRPRRRRPARRALRARANLPPSAPPPPSPSDPAAACAGQHRLSLPRLLALLVLRRLSGLLRGRGPRGP